MGTIVLDHQIMIANVKNNVAKDDDENSDTLINQQSENLWEQQQHTHLNSGNSTKTMKHPRLPNRTIPMRDDADLTPIILHEHRHYHHYPTKTYKRISNSTINHEIVTCDKVINNYSSEKDLWIFGTPIQVKLKLLSKIMYQGLSVVYKTQKDTSSDSDLHLGKCKNFNNEKLTMTTRDYCSSSVYRKKIIWQCFLIFMYIFFLNLSKSTCFAARQEETSGCTFPSRWEGSWFQSGVPAPINIKGSMLSNRGKCVASDGDKFLLVSGGCHRCVVIYEKHKNVLQYKESECQEEMYGDANPAAMPMRSILKSDHNSRVGGAHPNMNGHSRLSSSDQFLLQSNDDSSNCPGCRNRETLQYLCEQIPGDALLYSMFKENAEAVKCPLKGPFTFTYNRGHGECKSPISNIESCTEDSRLLLSFQACPDVSGTESTVEELTCLATWKDGNARYLVGLVSHHHATSNEERFRCFVYEKIQASMGGAFKDAEYKLAQSGDATCNGLESAEVGSRIMTLRKAQPTERCDFPTWFKGPKHWHALMGNAGYVFHPSDGSMHILKQTGYMETRALCEQINKQTHDEMQAVVHYTTGCKSGFMCMIFYRRDTHVAEIQMGKPATRVEDACAPDHFDPHKMPYVTLLATNAEASVCPLEGSYRIRGRIGPPYMTSRHKRGHAHHHHDTYHRRHGTLSFRNSEESEQLWQSAGRSLSPRHRRETQVEIVEQNSEVSDDTQLELRSKRDSPGCMINYNSNRRLRIGCTKHYTIDMNPSCVEELDEEYHCHGQWQENSTTFIVAKHAGSLHGVCITFKTNPDGTTGNLIVGDSCFRSTVTQLTPSDRHLVSNITSFGTCSDTSSSNTTQISWITILLCYTISSSFYMAR